MTDVAHELRTPLAIMRLRVYDLRADDVRDCLMQDLDRLTSRIEALLALARVRHNLEATETVDLLTVARDVVSDRAPRAAAAGCELALEAFGPSFVIANIGLIDTVLANLIDNAIAHAGINRSITVRLPRAGVIEVIDDGRGLFAENTIDVLQPFVRGSAAGQLGLGLALVQEAVTMMRGILELQETPGGGTTARVVLPLHGNHIFKPSKSNRFQT